MTINVPAGFETLAGAFEGAIGQAAYGKGKERHAVAGEAYEKQQICEIGRRVGSGYCLGQAVKKIYESMRLSPEAAVQELYGAMNYVAAQIILIKEGMQDGAGQKDRAPDRPAPSAPAGGFPGRLPDAPSVPSGMDGIKWSAAPSPEQAFSERRMAESMPGVVPFEDETADAMARAMAESAARRAGFSERRMRESMPGVVPCEEDAEEPEGKAADAPSAPRAQMSGEDMRRVCELASALAGCYERLQKEAPAGAPEPAPLAAGASIRVPCRRGDPCSERGAAFTGTKLSPQFKPTGEELAELQEGLNS